MGDQPEDIETQVYELIMNYIEVGVCLSVCLSGILFALRTVWASSDKRGRGQRVILNAAGVASPEPGKALLQGRCSKKNDYQDCGKME